MSLFRKKEVKTPISLEGIRSVKVLGSGCSACHTMYENACKAVEGLGVEVEYVTDMEKVMAHGVMSMPALVVNERVVSMGKVLKAQDIIKLISASQSNK